MFTLQDQTGWEEKKKKRKCVKFVETGEIS